MPEEKKCKYCATMVPKDAIICPHCHRRLKISIFTKGCWILILIFAGLLINSHWRSPEKRISKTDSATQEAQLTETGKKIKEAHLSWSNEDCNTIGEKKIRIGMNSNQVIAAWGKPYKINKTSIANSIHEKWTMNNSPNSTYLYFENGKLTNIQPHDK